MRSKNLEVKNPSIEKDDDVNKLVVALIKSYENYEKILTKINKKIRDLEAELSL